MFKSLFLFAIALQTNATVFDKPPTIKVDAGEFPLELYELTPRDEKRIFSRSLNDEIAAFAARQPAEEGDIKHLMSRVRDQGRRSSCSAFQAVGLAEQFFDSSVNFSEQCLIYQTTGADEGNSYQRLQSILRNGLHYEHNCPYVDPGDYSDWYTVDEKTRELLKQKALRTIPDLSNKAAVAISGRLVAKNITDLSAAARIDYARTKIKANIPVGLATLVVGSGWSNGLIDQIPTDKEIKAACSKTVTTHAGKKKCEGHAVIITGFDDRRGVFYFKNSWSDNWGVNSKYYVDDNWRDRTGYGVMSYQYFARFAIGDLLTLE